MDNNKLKNELEKLGLKDLKVIKRNLNYEEIYEAEKAAGTAVESKSGAMMIDTGIFTGRSPKDKYFVKEASSQDNLWWGPVNVAVDESVFDTLLKKVQAHYSGKNAFVFDGFAGASENSRMNVRMVSELAWQHHFCTNMFIRPTKDELDKFDADKAFTIINASNVTNEEYKAMGLNSENFVIFHLARKLAIIGGTEYGGEMKKGIFSIMNYYLPLKDVMAMHCSANMGDKGDVAIFFGLSGTGKTTLSADPGRKLIGDDEHGWDEKGIFNFEGGCYAKVIDLSAENEPDIYKAIRRDALLENVVYDKKTFEVDYKDVSKTQNTRVSYPINHIDSIVESSKGGHPNNIIFLTYDAFGVLPPVSRLSTDQALYHFLSGYTAKVAGTERGVTEPQATFSACFGAAFMTLHPTQYAELLGKKMREHNVKAFLVNTGFVGGGYSTGGKRIDLPSTRKIIDAILDGSINDAAFTKHDIFQVEFPTELSGIDASILNPMASWSDKDKYNADAKKLAKMFIDNFKIYGEDPSGKFDFSAFGPKID